ncbi:MAG: hypothetical protein LV481_08540 [Methylacidiphilales bacterium]|nr:hypothetical protein [Candidatus Methylacidiphilales bacterium]
MTCLNSWSDELKSRSNRIRSLIGNRHWLSDGHHKESLLRDILKRHLPKDWSVTRGFIVAPPPINSISPEVDILITNSGLATPWLNESELTITPPNGVLAHIHVKTEFGTAELKDALLHAYKVNQSMEHYRDMSRVWTGVIFFERTNITKNSQFEDTLTRALAKVKKAVGQINPNFLPHCIAILDKHSFIRRKVETANITKIRIECFESGGTAFASFIDSLLNNASTDNSYKGRSELNQLLQRVQLKRLFNLDLGTLV